MEAGPAASKVRSRKDFVELLETLLVGMRPDGPRGRTRPGRADRAAFRKVVAGSRGLTWRSRWGRTGMIPIADIARVALIEVEYLTARPPTLVALYALVIDRDEVVRVRIAAGGNRSAFGAAGKRQLREFWEPLGVVTKRETNALGRAKDYRRRWPEAFSFAHAYPVVSAAQVIAGWLLLVSPVLDRLFGE